MRSRLHQVLLLLFGCANTCIGIVVGQGGTAANVSFTVRPWTAEDGLPQNRITALAQTPDGYIWIGTLAGLARFDGKHFKLFDSYSSPALPKDAVNALAVGSDGALWVATRDGLFRVRAGEWKRFTTQHGLPSNLVWGLAVNASGELWVAATAATIGRFPGGNFRPTPWPVGGGYEPGRKFTTLSDGSLAVVLPHGIAPVSDESLGSLFHWPAAIPPDDFARAIERDSGGGWWLATGAGLWHGDASDHWTTVWTNAPTGPFVDGLYRDRHNSLWAQIGKLGLHFFDGSRLKRLALTAGQSQPSPSTFLEDREGNFWVGTDAGLYQLRPRNIEALTRADGLPADETWSVSEAPNGTLFLATNEGLTVRLPKLVLSAAPGNIAGTAHRCVLADTAGRVWTDASTPGLYRLELNPTKLQSLMKQAELGVQPNLARAVRLVDPWPLLPGETVHALYFDRAQRLWVGTHCGVHCFLDLAEIEYEGLPNAEIRCILESHDGTMWFGSLNGGLFRWRERALERNTTREGLADNFVIALHEDADGVLWVATHNGLMRLTPYPSEQGVSGRPFGRWFTFTTAHGLLDNLINHILEDDDGFLWFSCNRGIFRMSRAELNAVADGRQAEAGCAIFGTADGMPSAETNGEHQPAGCRSRDGRLWFATAMGAVAIDPKKIGKDEVPPLVVLQQVKADEKVVFDDTTNCLTCALGPGNKGIWLPPGRARVMEFHYAANSFSAPDKVRYKYRLKGCEKVWHSDLSNVRVALYANLRRGDYTFQVNACNPHGVWSQVPREFSFCVGPHFWQTWPFYMSGGASAFMIVLGLHRHRLRRLRRFHDLKQQRAVEQERTRIARDLHDDLGASLTGVALQLETAGRRGQADGEQLAALAAETRSVAHDLRELTWAINPRCDNSTSLATFLGEFVERFCQASELDCSLNLPENRSLRSVPARVRYELLVVLKESLTNVTKHARAHGVVVALHMDAREVHLVVRDDGQGFDPDRSTGGSGVRNLEERMHQLGGSFSVESRPGKGTTVIARLPLPNTPEPP